MSTNVNNRNRQPKGTSKGGQFAPETHTETPNDLDDLGYTQNIEDTIPEETYQRWQQYAHPQNPNKRPPDNKDLLEEYQTNPDYGPQDFIACLETMDDKIPPYSWGYPKFPWQELTIGAEHETVPGTIDSQKQKAKQYVNQHTDENWPKTLTIPGRTALASLGTKHQPALAKDRAKIVRATVAKYTQNPELLRTLAQDKTDEVQREAGFNKNLPIDAKIEAIKTTKNEEVTKTILENATRTELNQILQDPQATTAAMHQTPKQVENSYSYLTIEQIQHTPLADTYIGQKLVIDKLPPDRLADYAQNNRMDQENLKNLAERVPANDLHKLPHPLPDSVAETIRYRDDIPEGHPIWGKYLTDPNTQEEAIDKASTSDLVGFLKTKQPITPYACHLLSYRAKTDNAVADVIRQDPWLAKNINLDL